MLKISVIIPVYKVEQYLHQCVNSVLNQSYNNLEIILVDDGSPDGCYQICEEYARLDNRIIVIHKEHGGVSDARKCGIQSITGQYSMFIDGDDWIDENAIQKCVDRIKTTPSVECVIFSYIREYPEKSIVAHVMDSAGEFIGKDAECLVYRRLFGLIGDELKHPERLESLGSVCMKLYRTDLIKRGAFFDTKEVGSSEDTLFNIYALYGCQHFLYIDEGWYHYRKTGKSITSTYRPNLVKQWSCLFRNMEDYIVEHKLPDQYKQALNSRIALSVLGIGMNELANEHNDISGKIRSIKTYISSLSYQQAIWKMDLSNMPLAWRAMMIFAQHKMAGALSAELMIINYVRRKH